MTSTEQNFTHTFRDPGFYQVELIATNCAGSDVTSQTLEIIDVIEPEPDVFLVPSAVHAPGLNQTLWKTDLRIFNPGTEQVMVLLEYLPEDTNNNPNQGVIHNRRFIIEPLGTEVFDDIVQQIPGLQGDNNKGSLRFTYGEGTEVTPIIMSRTFNDTPDGTFGQFVRAVPVLENDLDFLLLTGLSENLYSRTNLSLANFSNQWAGGVTISVLNDGGEIIGDPVEVGILPNSTTQIVRIAEQAGIFTDLDIYSLYVFTNGNDIAVSASVVDNATGDPVHVESVDQTGTTFWLPGVARLAGANDSDWRSDVTFFNNTMEQMATDVTYISSPDSTPIGIPGFTLYLASANAGYFADLLGGSMLPPGVESKGHLVVKSIDGSPLPQVVGKTYNVDAHGGTFGQNLKLFGESDLIHFGGSGYIAGVSNSSDNNTGFRTNVGVLNTSEDNTATINIHIYDVDGLRAGGLLGLQIGPNVLVQGNVFDIAFLGNEDMNGSVRIEVLSGGPVAAYASVIDNGTQDPILVPAVILRGAPAN